MDKRKAPKKKKGKKGKKKKKKKKWSGLMDKKIFQIFKIIANSIFKY